MRTIALLALVAASLAACGSAGSSTAPPTTLTIVAKASSDSKASVHTLRCAPAGGTLAHPGRACQRLALLARPFAPTPKDVVCTELYGGPQTATVRGTYRGRRIAATFTRSDGCAIARWNRHAFLFPPGLGGSGPA